MRFIEMLTMIGENFNVVKKTDYVAAVNEVKGQQEVLTFNDKHWGAISRMQNHIHIHESSAIHNLQILEDNSRLDPMSMSRIEFQ